jgi:hypothetical protein
VTPQRFTVDRSTMFTVLLDVDPTFGRMESSAGRQRVSAALEAWYRSTSTDMHAFARTWSREH